MPSLSRVLRRDALVRRRRLFCKHCVAAGLAWLEGRAERIQAGPRARDLARLLRGLEKEQLARLLTEEADEHPDMVERLAARAARESATGQDVVRPHRRLVDRALATGDGVPYAEAATCHLAREGARAPP